MSRIYGLLDLNTISEPGGKKTHPVGRYGKKIRKFGFTLFRLFSGFIRIFSYNSQYIRCTVLGLLSSHRRITGSVQSWQYTPRG